MKNVLLITHSNENPIIDRVADGIRKNGIHPVRFNTDEYPEKSRLSVVYADDAPQYYLDLDGKRYHLNTFEAIWYRRVRIGDTLKDTLDQTYLQAAVGEARTTFFGMLKALPVWQLDDFSKVNAANHKIDQLAVARQLGLKIPKTLITNNKTEVLQFYQTCNNGMIAKMQSSFAIEEDDQTKVVFTNEITADDVEALEGLEFCPMQFQEKLEKKVELRATIIGDEVFTAAIDVHANEKAQHDWRKDAHGMLEAWKAYDLPQHIQKQLIALAEHYGLNYGAADIIVTPADEYYFLEINPAGEFAWTELKPPHFPLSQKIADLLTGKSNARR